MPAASKALVELAADAYLHSSQQEPSLLLILADMMEDEGDCRHNAVRNHAKCCIRGWGIACNLTFEEKIYLTSPELGVHPDHLACLEKGC